MKHKKAQRYLGLTLLFIYLFSLDVWAGPHLKKMDLSNSALSPYVGYMLVLIVLCILLPVAFFLFFNRQFKSIKTIYLLRRLAKKDQNFHWPALKKHCSDVFGKIHQASGGNNQTAAAAFCTTSFWETEQRNNFERWSAEGMKHRDQVSTIKYLSPVLLRHTGQPGAEDSIVVVNIKAKVEDYFEDAKTGEMLEGRKGFQNIEDFWTFQLIQGKWLLHNIEPSEFKSVYLNLRNEVPKMAFSSSPS